MCRLDNCKSICYYQLESNNNGTKVYIHYDADFNPIWVEIVRNHKSLGEFYPKNNLSILYNV